MVWRVFFKIEKKQIKPWTPSFRRNKIVQSTIIEESIVAEPTQVLSPNEPVRRSSETKTIERISEELTIITHEFESVVEITDDDGRVVKIIDKEVIKSVI